MSFQRIFDNIRDNVGGELKCIHLLCRKDIRNIEKSYRFNSVQRSNDDATSVAYWVLEMMENPENNPVIFYKHQGSPQSEECDNLCEDDFAICIQTPIQRSIMKKFGHQRIICIDSTHGTNGYDFSLVTKVVVDEFSEGYPVGWCLSNQEDQFVIENFLKPIKTRIVSITPRWFMSDDAKQFHSAWRSVFGNVDSKLLCTWHVDRAWHEKLALIKDKHTQMVVYNSLRLLLEEIEIQKFEMLLTKTVQQLQTNATTAEFSQYFINTYMGSKNQWASCYRQQSFININMHVEAFHHVLKYIYL